MQDRRCNEKACSWNNGEKFTPMCTNPNLNMLYTCDKRVRPKETKWQGGK